MRQFERAIQLVAGAQIIIAFVAFSVAVDAPAATVVRFIAYIVVYGITGVALITFGASDRRAEILGTFLLVSATAWTYPPIEVAASVNGSLLLQGMAHLPIHALNPYFLWHFVRLFPRPAIGRAPRAAVWIARSFLAIGMFLIAADFLQLFVADPALQSSLSSFSRNSPTGPYWTTGYLGRFSALVYAGYRAFYAALEERRRVRILLTGIIFGYLPLIFRWILPIVTPWVPMVAASPQGQLIQRLVVTLPLLSIPVVAAYAVLVHRALDVRLIIRKAVRYALARNVLILVAGFPFLVIVGLLYLSREQSVADLFSGRTGVIIGAAAIIGGLIAYLRRPLMVMIDRRFFREQYDSRAILTHLNERIVAISDVEILSKVLRNSLQSALHSRTIHTLFADDRRGDLIDPSNAANFLDSSSPLATLLENGCEYQVDWGAEPEWMQRLPESDRQWLVQTEAELLVPVVGRGGSLIGVLVLGEKLSELPFSHEDRALLATLSHSLALGIENEFGGKAVSRPVRNEAAESARTCLGCGNVEQAGQRRCSKCDESTVPAGIPQMVGGKFKLRRRLGAGAMGVVYEATDLQLRRNVALKALPAVSAREVQRMRQEARTMAALHHPGLAQIFSLEVSSGIPVIVMELLERGTLRDRTHAPIPASEALEIGSALCVPLSRLHGLGLLHRDVKPSNIGFAWDNTPKLLDFGLVHLIDGPGGDQSRTDTQGPENERGWWRRSTIEGGRFGTLQAVGTPLYMSPEAVRGAMPDTSFDLWALAMVVLECVTGTHPLLINGQDPLENLVSGAFPSVVAFDPSADASLIAFFDKALNYDVRERPRSADELSDLMRSTIASLSAEPSIVQPASG